MKDGLTKADRVLVLEQQIKQLCIQEYQFIVGGRAATAMDNEGGIEQNKKNLELVMKTIDFYQKELEKVKAEPEE